MSTPTPIDPKHIRIDLDTQSRVALNETTVKEYIEAMEAGQVFPPVLTFYDQHYILADGFHRFAAHMKVRPNEPILAEIRLGTVEDARWASIGANKSHGLRRTNDDKRNAVKQALLHPNGVDMSDRRIAEHVGVSHTTVQNVRREFESTGKICQSDSRVGQDGRTINTTNIGSGKTGPPPGSTCGTCRSFDKARCQVHDTEPLPFEPACDEWEIMVEDVPNPEMPPPDYDNLEAYDDTKKKPKSSNPHQYKRLKGCLTVHLPPDNAQLFAIELRNAFKEDYLMACVASLHHLLTDKDD